MDKFIGRKNELKLIQETYESSKFRCCAIIGRRRIGKTALIKEFIKDKDSIYIQFMNSDETSNLRIISDIMGLYLKKNVHYDDMAEFFLALGETVRKRKTIIVFDEFQFISSRCPDFSGMVQMFIDSMIGESFLMISGSSIGMMMSELEYNRPLYGRVRKIEIGPMEFRDCVEFHDNFSDADQIKLYLTVGGVPFYYDETPSESFDDYIKRYFLSNNAIFSNEGENMINRELSPNSDYYSILDSIASGNYTVNQISTSTRLDRKLCERYIKVMENIGFVCKTMPMAGAPIKPSRFEISDNMLAFYFYVLRNGKCSILDENERFESMKQIISTFHGRMFERFCADFIVRNYAVERIGKWWGVVNKEGLRENSDIDIVADVISGKNKIELFAECKFRNSKVGYSALDDLKERIGYTKHGTNFRLMIFSREFGEDFIDYCNENGILLVNTDVLIGKTEKPVL